MRNATQSPGAGNCKAALPKLACRCNCCCLLDTHVGIHVRMHASKIPTHACIHTPDPSIPILPPSTYIQPSMHAPTFASWPTRSMSANTVARVTSSEHKRAVSSAYWGERGRGRGGRRERGEESEGRIGCGARGMTTAEEIQEDGRSGNQAEGNPVLLQV